MAAVREGARQQRRIVELMRQAVLQAVSCGGQRKGVIQ
jgi:hypothetical protein